MNLPLLVDQHRRFPNLTWAQHGLLHGCSAEQAREAWLEATEAVTRGRPDWWRTALDLHAGGFNAPQIARVLSKQRSTVWRAIREMAA